MVDVEFPCRVMETTGCATSVDARAREIDHIAGATKAELLTAMRDAVLGTAELVGTYERGAKPSVTPAVKAARQTREATRQPSAQPPRGASPRRGRTTP